MSLNVDINGTLTVLEARERVQSGVEVGTLDTSYLIDTASSIDLTSPLWELFYHFGIYFESTDNKVSFFSDGSVEANEFLEGARTYIDNIGRLSVVFLKEIQ